MTHQTLGKMGPEYACRKTKVSDNLTAARSTYIKVRCEGDRTIPLYSEGGDADSASFSSKPLMLVIIHSDAVAVIKVRDKKEGNQFYGQVGAVLAFQQDLLHSRTKASAANKDPQLPPQLSLPEL